MIDYFKSPQEQVSSFLSNSRLVQAQNYLRLKQHCTKRKLNWSGIAFYRKASHQFTSSSIRRE
ncbi:hypothetical protein [Microseira sp. BLCC-F43]|uniref:hypothetical protein n=1 Tax=Microseira sp. BLCC-F43 TaxID=3153602 RepID=UPI0035B7B89A